MFKRLAARTAGDATANRVGASHATAGDLARDAKDWPAAIERYEAYLAQVPSGMTIWVQLGNCAKEAGDFARSLSAYRQAIALEPGVADTYLQLGHLFKVMGRLHDAQDQYRAALERDPDLADARHEIAAITRSITALPFLLPATFLDFVPAGSIPELLASCDRADPRDDPFRRYREIVVG